jgi:hypothetical protein
MTMCELSSASAGEEASRSDYHLHNSKCRRGGASRHRGMLSQPSWPHEKLAPSEPAASLLCTARKNRRSEMAVSKRQRTTSVPRTK